MTLLCPHLHGQQRLLGARRRPQLLPLQELQREGHEVPLHALQQRRSPTGLGPRQGRGAPEGVQRGEGLNAVARVTAEHFLEYLWNGNTNKYQVHYFIDNFLNYSQLIIARNIYKLSN